eukprot:2371070-Prymnesium_polylepis.1
MEGPSGAWPSGAWPSGAWPGVVGCVVCGGGEGANVTSVGDSGVGISGRVCAGGMPLNQCCAPDFKTSSTFWVAVASSPSETDIGCATGFCRRDGPDQSVFGVLISGTPLATMFRGRGLPATTVPGASNKSRSFVGSIFKFV